MDTLKVSLSELVDLMGEPTFNEEDGGDGKINRVTIVTTETFTPSTIKTYDTNYTMTKLTKWNVVEKPPCTSSTNSRKKLEKNRENYFVF